MDKRARQILFDTYWSSAGWKDNPSTAPEQFEYAVAAGYMFHPTPAAHDSLVEDAIHLAAGIDPAEVANSFLASLSSRRLDLRSALGSYAVARLLPRHSFALAPGWGCCFLCGEYEREASVDWNVLNFERHKWGGVRHEHPEYVTFDLRNRAGVRAPAPTDEDHRLMARMLDTIQRLPPRATARDLEKALTGVLPSNGSERKTLINILGYCGILETKDRRGFWQDFPPYVKRDYPPVSKTDWGYPVRWWRRSDGVNREALTFWFPGASFIP